MDEFKENFLKKRKEKLIVLASLNLQKVTVLAKIRDVKRELDSWDKALMNQEENK
jgi:hypothetical protein